MRVTVVHIFIQKSSSSDLRINPFVVRTRPITIVFFVGRVAETRRLREKLERSVFNFLELGHGS